MFGHEDTYCWDQQKGKKVWVPKAKVMVPENTGVDKGKSTMDTTSISTTTARVVKESNIVVVDQVQNGLTGAGKGKDVDTTVEILSVSSLGVDQGTSSATEDTGNGGVGRRRGEELIDKGSSPQ